MPFFSGYLAQGVGGSASFLENSAAGYVRAPVTLTSLSGGDVALTGTVTNGSSLTGTQLGLYDAATGGNLIMWWNVSPAAQFTALAATVIGTPGPSFTIPALDNQGTTGNAAFSAQDQIGTVFYGAPVMAGVPVQVVNGTLSATASGRSSANLLPSVTRLSASAALPSTSGPVSIRQTSSGTYTLPASPVDGTTINVKDALANFATYNAVVVAGTGDTVANSSSFIMATNGESAQLIYDATNKNWDVT